MTTQEPWFDQHGNITRDLPEDCIADCSAPGQVDEAVTHWRETLGFTVPRDLAIDWLQEFGAWERKELEDSTDELLAERVLWLAASDYKEQGEWFGLTH